MKVGFSKISDEQRKLLEKIKNPLPQAIMRDVLREFVLLPGLSDGDEEIHPSWIPYWRKSRSLVLIQGVSTSETMKLLRSFFDPLVPHDVGVDSIDPAIEKLTFLLGAGASKPSPSGIPTVKELLPELMVRARRLDRDDLTNLVDFCEKKKISNIEDLLTAAHLSGFASKNSSVLNLMNYLLYQSGKSVTATGQPEVRVADLSSVAFLQDTLQVLFGLLSSTMLAAKPNAAHEAIAKYVSQRPGTAVVTTNYDCCMDIALWETSPELEYEIEISNAAHATLRTETIPRLIKLHGSLNWYYCDTCQEIQLIDIKKMIDLHMNDKLPFPVIGICRTCGGQRRALLVPPLAMKFDLAPPLTPLIGKAQSCFQQSDVIVVLGFSFAEADIYISRMLSKSMQMTPSQRLVIVDPDAKVVDKVKRKLGSSIPNFDTSRISKIDGDCSVLLPKFLNGEFKAVEEVPVQTTAEPSVQQSLN